MATTTFNASNYLTRADLEKHIIASVGQDIKANKEAGHEIKGKQKELKALNLSDTTTIWGVKVVCSDKSTDKILKDKVKEKGQVWKK